ncbi:hypothetical protein [Nocardiopsis halotolerans]|uniref:hypothetical protein n=1 Tax=Nocardiopsis halotolerans TaxID=124252 RepID=UPI00035E1ABD|nr:hypothetical protein [Nocardiopsis halotolerans]
MNFWHGFTSTAVEVDHAGHRYRVGLRLFTLGKNITLSRDGEVVERASSPARFVLEDGAKLEIETSEHGFRRAVLRTPATTTRLQPADGTWEAARHRWAREHPMANGVIVVAATIILAAALLTAVLSLLQLLTSIDAVSDMLGGWSFTMPVTTSPVLLVAFGVAVGMAALDTALRMR